jgi:hypothetical protein
MYYLISKYSKLGCVDGNLAAVCDQELQAQFLFDKKGRARFLRREMGVIAIRQSLNNSTFALSEMVMKTFVAIV